MRQFAVDKNFLAQLSLLHVSLNTLTGITSNYMYCVQGGGKKAKESRQEWREEKEIFLTIMSNVTSIHIKRKGGLWHLSMGVTRFLWGFWREVNISSPRSPDLALSFVSLLFLFRYVFIGSLLKTGAEINKSSIHGTNNLDHHLFHLIHTGLYSFSCGRKSKLLYSTVGHIHTNKPVQHICWLLILSYYDK